jgi:broad specificity phosphatase PhoE
MGKNEGDIEIFFVRHGQSTENSAVEKGITYDPHNIELTDIGKSQAKITGNYLKTYGKFDVVFHSPLTRCVQTMDIICDELGYQDKKISCDMLIELGGLSDKLSGLSADDRKKIINKNKELTDIEKHITTEKNLFEKSSLYEKLYNISNEYFEYVPSLEQHIHDSKEFLKLLKNQKCSKILVVCHGGTIFTLSKLVTNLNPCSATVSMVLPEQTTQVKNPEPFTDSGNCNIMAVLLKDGIFQLIIPANNLHLKYLKSSV